MGKQKQKKRKLNSTTAPPVTQQQQQQQQPSFEEKQCLDAEDLETTVKTLTAISRDEALFMSKECRSIRQLLFQLIDLKQHEGSSLTQRVSLCLRDGRWNEAIFLLASMRERGQVPKLGALQRWTRDLDAVSSTDHNVMQVLDAILRTADPSIIGCAAPKKEDAAALNLLPPFPQSPHPHPSPSSFSSASIVPDTEKYAPLFKVVYKEEGADRKPANVHDMILYHNTSQVIPLNPPQESVQSINVPNLPRVTILKNVLSVQECRDIVQVAESMGFTKDTPVGGSSKEMTSVLAENFFWLADTELVDRIYSRVLAHLPPEINNQPVCGLNARWRVYKYTPGSIYRPHIDGAWPGSGLTSKGEYIYDAYGDRWSKLTFLIRLNEDFKGGATTYFTPSHKEGVMDVQPVKPSTGDVLLFPHGDTQGSLLHEGSPVIDSEGEFPLDAKYVVRTEVLYKINGHVQKEI